MKLHTIKTDSLAHLSYLLIDGEDAAVIDPRRDSEEYVQRAYESGARIRYIFETHRNEDLVTGSRELARYTDAPIYHGKGLEFKFGEYVKDNDSFKLGSSTLKILETPGHTPESISIAIFPEKDCDKAVGVFTGDALFVSDVGRTDFFKDRLEEFAGMLFDSIHQKLLPLGDQTVIYPAHGAGSVCGGGISDREVSTLGFERMHNPRLQLSREAFIKAKVAEKHEIPPYFKQMEAVNLNGDDKPLQNYHMISPLDLEEFKSLLKSDQVIDVRNPEAYLGCHVPGSLSLPESLIAAYGGYFLNYNDSIGLICEDFEQAERVSTELLRLGFDNPKVFLKGGVSAWETAGEKLTRIKEVDVHEIKSQTESRSTCLLDVRKPSEWDNGIIKGARTLFLGDLNDNLKELDRDQETIVYCGSGKRATIGASLLSNHGFDKVSVFMGSMKAYQAREKNA